MEEMIDSRRGIMKIYRISTEDHGKYAYAAGYGPFGDMPFIDSVGAYMRKMMEESWNMFPEEPGLHVEERASCWPDVMFCGCPPPPCFYSRNVLESLAANGIAVKRATAIPVGKISKGKLKSIPSPDYFVIEAFPGIRVDYAASGFVVDADGNPDPNVPVPRLPPPCSMILQLGPVRTFFACPTVVAAPVIWSSCVRIG